MFNLITYRREQILENPEYYIVWKTAPYQSGWYSESKIVNFLLKGNIILNVDVKDKPQVSVVRRGDLFYLRSKKNGIEVDNLSKLPDV